MLACYLIYNFMEYTAAAIALGKFQNQNKQTAVLTFHILKF